MPQWQWLILLCSFPVGFIVGALIGYLMALRAASWGIRASTEARSGQTGLFGPHRGSPEVQMAEERDRYMEAATQAKYNPDDLNEQERP